VQHRPLKEIGKIDGRRAGPTDTTLTPLSVQHAETTRNPQQENGLDKRILQRTATPRNRVRRIVAPKVAGAPRKATPRISCL
jgi:hypothetical protein